MRFCGWCICEWVKTCYICKEIIADNISHVKCVKCNNIMHNYCFIENNRIHNDYRCVACQSLGTIGIDSCFENIDEYVI